jgi:hypothetical protein
MRQRTLKQPAIPKVVAEQAFKLAKFCVASVAASEQCL